MMKPEQPTLGGQIEAIRDTPDMLDWAVKGLTDEQLDTSYREGSWTLRQVVHHLADSHIHAYTRMKRLLLEENPTIQAYDEKVWAELADARTMPIAGSLAIVRGVHERMYVMLQNISEADLDRTGTHTEDGPIYLRDLVATYSIHGIHHLRMIERLRIQKGWQDR